ncbi:TPA: cellulose biosynthesis protein BcsQ [Kluyvera cryocrescens]|uniref:Cellulose biosynthesis protein BcsQ n=1 Tax=Kluyvera cryocrescens TaxID=580 RepID=A0AAW9C1J7_KLUCR|nr:cellulose biosynthesis protein BcsQ [Kluyvera cryocrescens]MCX2868652.1 cellulose biosynthesis protein BcsQ [Kluyvera cryocrescens]MDU5686522.1 cellulose biosynthesis protein BcsQ [Kluyvera cryocrescens]MDW3775923.1 cellulose biosynthesis protein BcsQ [Kluyvera cryocrescens]MEB6634478.1 cellulose biosynthesis protein BcsQ [Kluyvera cryocrescens]WNN72024.1 cellulose biosynthesis protein BcsQ [Kluyvera cryocrescens]
MAILGLQGVRGGVGTTSITAALAWSLQLLGESVLVIDASPDNMLRLSFNDDIARETGWARAALDGQDWRDAGLRYTSLIDVLPFGKLQPGEQQNIATLTNPLMTVTAIAREAERQGKYQWILLDLPHGFYPWTPSLVEACHFTLTVVKPDANCHIRLHQQPLPANSHILLNGLRMSSPLQEDLYQVWLQTQRRLLPVVIHRDEAMAESLASKQPLGEYRHDSLAAEELITLASWCLMHYAGHHAAAEREA